MVKPSFEESISVIDKCLALRRHKWNLDGYPSVDYDDVSQIIRLHIFNKWHLYKEEFPLANWVNRIISNQFINIKRMIYGNASRPCLQCPANEGSAGDGTFLCYIYQKQCSDCPFYAAWEKGKKYALDIKLPVTLEHHTQEVYDLPTSPVDVEKTIRSITEKMQHVLKPDELKIYHFLYVDGLSEEQIARKLGYKSNEKEKQEGFRFVTNIRKIIITKIKKVIKEDEIEM